jgi:hypothetical protein
MHINSAYRGPDHKLTKRNPTSQHATGRAFDVRAKTTEQGDARMAELHAMFQKRGLVAGEDYRIDDEVRRPAGHATGPHIHTQLTPQGMAKYQKQAAQAAQNGKAATQGWSLGAEGTADKAAHLGAEPIPGAAGGGGSRAARRGAAVDGDYGGGGREQNVTFNFNGIKDQQGATAAALREERTIAQPRKIRNPSGRPTFA